MSTKTKVGSMAECEMIIWSPLDIKTIRLVKLPVISISGGMPDTNMITGFDYLVVDLRVARANTGKLNYR